jgi:hypothetical protein
MPSESNSKNNKESCFVCSRYMDERRLSRGKRKSVHQILQRRVLVCSLQDVLLCPGCKGSCIDCACVIPQCQVRDYEGRCEDCRKKNEEQNKGRKRLKVGDVCKKSGTIFGKVPLQK